MNMICNAFQVPAHIAKAQEFRIGRVMRNHVCGAKGHSEKSPRTLSGAALAPFVKALTDEWQTSGQICEQTGASSSFACQRLRAAWEQGWAERTRSSDARRWLWRRASS